MRCPSVLIIGDNELLAESQTRVVVGIVALSVDVHPGDAGDE
jgi:hypothetical protein